MKKRPNFLLLLAFLFFLGASVGSCSRKTGCPINDPANVGAQMNKKGLFKSKKSKSNLFPKNMRRGR